MNRDERWMMENAKKRNGLGEEGRTEVMKTKEKVYDLWEQKAHSNNRVTA